VSAKPCSSCRFKKPGKYAAAYWAWFNADGTRSAWKQRFCAPCAQSALHTLLLTLSNVSSDSSDYDCVECGADATSDDDPVYLTLYVPGREPTEYVVPLDAPCAVSFRMKAMTGAERLPDRGGVVRGPSTSDSDWDQLTPVPV